MRCHDARQPNSSGTSFLFRLTVQFSPVRPRPLYRSLTFWSGILVIGFLCWAWRDSHRNLSLLTASHYAAFSEGGLLGLIRHPAPFPRFEAERERSFFLQPLYSFGMNEHPIKAASFPPPLRVRSVGSREEAPPTTKFYHEVVANNARNLPVGTWLLAIPHWLFLLAVTLTWSGLLLCRARRHRRATGKAAAPWPWPGGHSA